MTDKPPAPSDLADKFMLRLPSGMRDAIRVAAEANNRSMNAEIVARLGESLNEGFGPHLLRLHVFVGSPQEKLHTADVLESYARHLRSVAGPELDQQSEGLRAHRVQLDKS